MTYGILFPDQKDSTSLEQDGCSETSSMNKVKSSETRHDWLHKVIVSKRG